MLDENGEFEIEFGWCNDEELEISEPEPKGELQTKVEESSEDEDVKPVGKLDEVPEVVREFMVFPRIYVRNLPKEMIIGFNAWTKEDQWVLYEQWKLSTSDLHLKYTLMKKGEAELVFRPNSIRLLPNGSLIVTTTGKSQIVIPFSVYNEFGIEVIEKGYIYAKVEMIRTKQKMIIRAIDIAPISLTPDEETAKAILHEVEPYQALMYGLGVYPKPESIGIFLPRLVALFHVDGRPIHVMQLTPPSSGKSEFAYRIEQIMNFYTFPEFPTPAKLVGDARKNSLGVVYQVDGLIIDEVDKVKKERFEECYDTLLTGMEQGKWRRGVSTIHDTNIEVTKRIPIIFFGNWDYSKVVDDIVGYTETTRQKAKSFLGNRLNLNLEAFFDRIAIVDMIDEFIPIQRYLIRDEEKRVGILRDAVMKGIIQLTQREVEPISYIDHETSRRDRSVNDVASVVKVLAPTIYDNLEVDKWVDGSITLISYLKARKSEFGFE